MTHFVRIVNETGVVDGWGDIPASQIPFQAYEGMTVLECGPETVQKEVINNRTSIGVDLDWLKQSLRAMVDMNCGLYRTQFITDIPGQSYAYNKKESEAINWVVGDDVANPQKYPFLIAEAEALGVSVADVRQSIVSKIDEVAPKMAKIEAIRISAKSAISNSQNISEAISHAIIDFDLIIGPS